MDIYVGNMSYDTDENKLRSLFSEYGSVQNIKMLTDRDTGQSRGVAFVSMDDWKEAEAAIKALDGADVDGRPLRVNKAEQKSERSSYGGGGHRGGHGGGGHRGGHGGRNRSNRGNRY